MELGVLLVVVLAGLSAFAHARRQRTWSWPLFAKTLLGLLVLCALIFLLLTYWFPLDWGRRNPGLATLIIVAGILLGVALLTWWVNRQKPGRGQNTPHG